MYRLFFKKFQDALGGRIYLIATEGAPLNQETQDIVIVCLDCKFVVGYGLTECTALCTISPPAGGYSTKDKPYPRGEVVVGGKSVTAGYYYLPDLTKKMYEEKDGIRWFYTGDIGELLSGNRLRLIDRRKDLVKLSTGEYVALGQVESRLKSCPEVDNVCVSAAAQNRLLALVVPNYEVLKQRFGSSRSLGDMCRDPAVVRYIFSMLRKHGLMSTETFEMLNKAFPNDPPKRTTVFEWHSRFKAGRISIEDDPRQGRPKFQRTDENVQKITDLIKVNPRTTLLELEQDTGISKTTIGRIVTEDLKLKKTPAKFIPRFLTNEQKLCRLATCEDMMEMTRTDPEWKDKIITGDETWVYGYDPETKPQSAEWRAGLNSREIPADCRLVADDWTPDSGLVTAALKLKRHSIEDYYRDHIQEMMNNVS
ncbi:ACSL4, partial [Cordylochernes scorpioides]